MNYLKQAATPRQTPQSEPIPGSDQVANRAGGHGWTVSSMERLRRFLILGSESGSYYVNERKLTAENLDGVRAALDEHGPDAVLQITEISMSGRAPKNDPALYALAIACAHRDPATRRSATAAIPVVARTGTHLFHFAEFVQGQRGWGPALRKGIAAWYERDDVAALAYQLVKYRQRDGWTHRDLLRLSHPDAPTPAHRVLYDWVCGRGIEARSLMGDGPFRSVAAFTRAQESASANETARLIGEFGGALPREALSSEHLTSPVVWGALLGEGMPMTALVRNLPTLTRLNVLKPMSRPMGVVVDQLNNAEAIKRSRIHPLSILGAMAVYGSGASVRGSATWTPEREVIDALDSAFYLAFENAPKTGKRQMLGLDVSGSMTYGSVAGMPGLSPRTAAAAMAMAIARSGDPYTAIAFSHELVTLPLSSKQRLDDVMRMTNGMMFGGTDCSLPMLYALEKGMEVDVFTILTDNETWAGGMHPSQALCQYRDRTGIDAKLVVVGMTADNFTIADPDDAGMLDVVGFDSAAPQVIAEFAAGNI